MTVLPEWKHFDTESRRFLKYVGKWELPAIAICGFGELLDFRDSLRS
jgi:hypothetical protein